MSYNNLKNYYETNSQLRVNHSFTNTDIEKLYPFERDIEIDILLDRMKSKANEETVKISKDEIASYGIQLQKVKKN